MSTPAVLLGVDIVAADRLAKAAERGGETFDRVMGGGGPTFSVKESFIKAVGGRPPGFTWHDFQETGDAPSGWAGRLLDEAAAELITSTGLALPGRAVFTVSGASRKAALVRLPPHEGLVSGAARWGHGSGLFVSLAIVFVRRKGNP
ncbi:phosphopantetheinyl transferase [Nonomuraea typhae]|uniref:phosphopantetheinyl transferase n=1 Tax=Nonomuraea typhae TaxID=2603600 RepID=UPI0012FAF6F0|nr:phosphopantetheinyl transferase [Nonomuraea typhae]